MDFAQAMPVKIGTFDASFSPAYDLRQLASPVPGALTWVANLAIYVPIVVPYNYPVRRVYWTNGSTITTTNVVMGIYSESGAQLYATPSTAMVGASAAQYVTLAADMILSPGRYYLAWLCSGTTSRGDGTATWTATMLRNAGVLQQAVGSTSLPAQMTPAAVANALYPHCGISRLDTGF